MERAGILTDWAIRTARARGEIKIEPYNDAHVNPVSYDLTLGGEVRIYNKWVLNGFPGGGCPIPDRPDGTHLFKREGEDVLDVKEEPETTAFKIDPEFGWVLKPGIGYLMHTCERVFTKHYVPIIDGKSSIGRLFIQVHITAGFGDPGFDGQYTLEVVVQHPVRVYAGMRICQIRFQNYNDAGHGEPTKTYDQVGSYNGDFARGAIPSRVYRQFQK